VTAAELDIEILDVETGRLVRTLQTSKNQISVPSFCTGRPNDLGG